jgi:chloride channel 7
MMEITNDIRFLLPIMTAILISKLVADQITHSLYHALLELKCIPFIGGDPPPHTTSLDSHAVSQIMNKNVIVFPIESTAVAIIDT